MAHPEIPARDAGISIAAAVLTLLLHLAPFAQFVHAVRQPVPPPAEERKPAAVERIYQAGVSIYTNPLNASLATGQPCPGHSYIGIGVLLSYMEGRIIDVGDNTPAQRSGLRRGDSIVNVDVLDGSVREGTIHHLIVSREGLQVPVRVVVGRICALPVRVVAD